MQMRCDVEGDLHASTWNGQLYLYLSGGAGGGGFKMQLEQVVLVFLLSMTAHSREHLTLLLDVVQLTVVTPGAGEPLQAAHSGREDLSNIPAGTSHIPASLLSKLSVVNLHDAAASCDKLRDTASDALCQDTGVGMSSAVSKRPLIEELDL